MQIPQDKFAFLYFFRENIKGSFIIDYTHITKISTNTKFKFNQLNFSENLLKQTYSTPKSFKIIKHKFWPKKKKALNLTKYNSILEMENFV